MAPPGHLKKVRLRGSGRRRAQGRRAWSTKSAPPSSTCPTARSAALLTQPSLGLAAARKMPRSPVPGLSGCGEGNRGTEGCPPLPHHFVCCQLPAPSDLAFTSLGRDAEGRPVPATAVRVLVLLDSLQHGSRRSSNTPAVVSPLLVLLVLPWPREQRAGLAGESPSL